MYIQYISYVIADSFFNVAKPKIVSPLAHP